MAARQGDRLAGEILGKAKEALATGLVSVAHCFNAQRIVLGGGIVQGMPEVVEEMEQRVRRRAMKAALGQIKIVEAKLGGVAGAVGAAAMPLLRD